MALYGYRYMLTLVDSMCSVANVYYWRPGWNRSEDIPEQYNQRGLYHFKAQNMPHLMIGVGVQVKCELAGRIWEHENGYRAQWARIVSVVRFYREDAAEHFQKYLEWHEIELSVFARFQYEEWKVSGRLITLEPSHLGSKV